MTQVKRKLIATLCGGCLIAFGSVLFAQSSEEVEIVDPPPPQTPLGEVPQADVNEATELIVQQTNTFRQQQGLPKLKTNPELVATAKYFADFMARTQKYGHTADGNKPSQRASEHDYEYCIVLENIAYLYQPRGIESDALAEHFVEGWKNSPGHRKNMVDPDIVETGVAVSQHKDVSQYFAVQMFGRPRSDAIEFKITNRSGQVIQYSVVRQGKRSQFDLPVRGIRTHTQCRPAHLDWGWTEQNDKVPTESFAALVIQRTERGELKVVASKRESQSK